MDEQITTSGYHTTVFAATAWAGRGPADLVGHDNGRGAPPSGDTR